MKVLLMLPQGVELMEFSPFVDVFGWHKHYNNGDIEIVTCGLRKEIMSTFNIPLRADIVIDEVNAEDYAALAIPGGFGDFGFYEDAYDNRFLDIIKAFDTSGKPIASICVAALPIGRSGVLTGRSATTYHLMGGRRQAQLKEFGVNIINEPVVTDRNIITSWCPSTAVDVALKLLEMLTSAEAANIVRQLMGFQAEARKEIL